MLVMSSDGKIVMNCVSLQVIKNFGVKDGKYVIMGGSESADYGSGVLAYFADEKLATDALAKAFDAFTSGASSYRF